METLELSRSIHGTTIKIFLTNEELETAYRIRERNYLAADFINALEEQESDGAVTSIKSSDLEAFPEITEWLTECFENFFDANLSHNDLIELTLNHLNRASKISEFFTSMAANATGSGNRAESWRTLAAHLCSHKTGSCDCCETTNKKVLCSAALYLQGYLTIQSFFNLECGKEAA